MRASFDMPCNLCPVVATLELTANCVKETLPIVRRRSSSNLKNSSFLMVNEMYALGLNVIVNFTY